MVERIASAADTAHLFRFLLTARAENFLEEDNGTKEFPKVISVSMGLPSRLCGLATAGRVSQKPILAREYGPGGMAEFRGGMMIVVPRGPGRPSPGSSRST